MIDELVRLLHQQGAAAVRLEGRLRALELLVAAGEQRFIALALDEMQAADEALAALELTRALALSTAGLPVDVVADDLVASMVDRDDAALLRGAVEHLRGEMRRLDEARRRTHLVVSTHAQASRSRLESVSAFANH